MKSAKSAAIGIALVAGIAGTLTPSESVYAQVSNHAGQICRNRITSEVNDFRWTTSGVENRGTAPRKVICPLVSKTDVSQGLKIDVDAGGNPNQPTSCALASFNWTGDFLGSTVGTITPPDRFVRLTLPASQTATFAYYSVECTLPVFGTLRSIVVY